MATKIRKTLKFAKSLIWIDAVLPDMMYNEGVYEIS